jgi:hypothetical protein
LDIGASDIVMAEHKPFFAGITAPGCVGMPDDAPDDVGPTISSLLGEDNRSINAQRIEVSGGRGIRSGSAPSWSPFKCQTDVRSK